MRPELYAQEDGLEGDVARSGTMHPLAQSVDILQKREAHLSELLTQLEARLSPVLADYPSESRVQEEADKQPGTSLIVCTLRELDRNFESLAYRIIQLLKDLEV